MALENSLFINKAWLPITYFFSREHINLSTYYMSEISKSSLYLCFKDCEELFCNDSLNM